MDAPSGAARDQGVRLLPGPGALASPDDWNQRMADEPPRTTVETLFGSVESRRPCGGRLARSAACRRLIVSGARPSSSPC